MLIDEEQEGAVNGETDLGGQGHEPHCGHGGSLGALFIHRDGTLVLELFQNGKESCQIPSVGTQRERRYGGVPSHSENGSKDHIQDTDHSWSEGPLKCSLMTCQVRLLCLEAVLFNQCLSLGSRILVTLAGGHSMSSL